MARAKAPSKRKAPAKKRAPAKRGARSRKGNVITVDFTDVDSGGGMPTPDGFYTAEIRSCVEEVSQNSGEPYLAVRWKTHIGSTVFDNWSLQPQALWKLRTALECMGVDVPDAEYQLDIDGLEGMACGLEIVNEEYEERDRPRVTGYLPIDLAEEQIGGTTPAVGDEDEDEDEPEPDVEDEDEDEDDDEAPPKKAARKKKAPAKKKSAAIRPGARVTFEDEDGDEFSGVVEFIDDGTATVVDDEENEWEIPVEELTKA